MEDDDEYDEDDEEVRYLGRKRKPRSKNQQIYGDFYEAYEPQSNPFSTTSNRESTYSNFKAGETINNYSAEAEVHIPKNNKMRMEEQEPEPVTVGEFNLQSFLKQFDQDKLEKINEESEEESKQSEPKGLNQKIIDKLKLVKLGDEPQEIGLAELTLEQYLRTNRKKERKLTEEEREKAKEFSQGYGVGFSMMKNMGFANYTKGLGKDETGTDKPVEAVHKKALTAKDRQRQGDNSEDDSKSEEESVETTPYDLFDYTSQSPKIKEFLNELKKQYDQAKQKQQFYGNIVESFQREVEITSSLQLQRQNELQDLQAQIQQLQQLSKDNLRHPHLSLQYKIDVLLAKETMNRLKGLSFQELLQEVKPQLSQLQTHLTNIYLEKEKEQLQEYKRVLLSSGMPSNRETFNVEDIIVLSSDDEKKIREMLQAIIQETVLPQIQHQCTRSSSISQLQSPQLIATLEFLKKCYDGARGNQLERFISTVLRQKCNEYLRTVALDQKMKMYPHMIIFPWLNVVPPECLNFMQFFMRVSSKLWMIEDRTLYNIIHPLLKFCSRKESSFFLNLYLAPRLFCEMEKFKISDSQENKDKITGFILYSSLLSMDTREEIIQNTIFLEILAVYKEQRKSSTAGELQKWLAIWIKCLDKVASGLLKRLLTEYLEIKV